MPLPKSIASDDEKLGGEVNEAWLSFQRDVELIRTTDDAKGQLIESACRTLWSLWDDEAKREIMGWASWEDLFHPGNEELTDFFMLIEDRIVLTSSSNQNRFYNLLLIDSDPTMSELHILRRKHWTPITQFNSRISRLKDLLREEDGEDKLNKAKDILAPAKTEEKDPEPLDKDWDMKREVGYWRGKPAIRLTDDSQLALKFRSRLTLVKAYFVLKKGESVVIATNDDKTTSVAQVLIPQSDPDYQDFVNWASGRLGVKVVG